MDLHSGCGLGHECTGPPSVCYFAEGDRPVEGDTVKLVVHEPTGLTLYNEVREGNRLINRFEVRSLQLPGATGR